MIQITKVEGTGMGTGDQTQMILKERTDAGIAANLCANLSLNGWL